MAFCSALPNVCTQTNKNEENTSDWFAVPAAEIIGCLDVCACLLAVRRAAGTDRFEHRRHGEIDYVRWVGNDPLLLMMFNLTRVGTRTLLRSC